MRITKVFLLKDFEGSTVAVVANIGRDETAEITFLFLGPGLVTLLDCARDSTPIPDNAQLLNKKFGSFCE
jgi:hypothetical protein